MPNPLISYQQTRFANVLTLTKRLAQHTDDETLHDLRVELKRIRFIKNVVLQYLEDSGINKAYKPFRKLFKKLGKIRGQHVNIYRLKTTLTNTSEPSAQKHFEKKKQRLEEQLLHLINKSMDGLHAGINTLNKFALRIKAWSDDDFVRSLKRQVRKRITKRTTKKNLHRARHLLKAVMYSAELSPVLAKKIHKVFNVPVVKHLEDAIGDWHDLSLLLKGKTVQLLKSKTRRKIEGKKQQELKRVSHQIPKLFIP
jgi:CHAD domain-containing protein